MEDKETNSFTFDSPNRYLRTFYYDIDGKALYVTKITFQTLYYNQDNHLHVNLFTTPKFEYSPLYHSIYTQDIYKDKLQQSVCILGTSSLDGD